MRGFGVFLLVAGVLWLLVAMSMDTSVAVGDGRRINNIGLIADQQNHIMLGGMIALAGLLTVIFGGRKNSASSDGVAGADARPCPFCAEPIRRSAIKCKHCGSTVDPEAEPVLKAGWVANIPCKDAADRANVCQMILNSQLPAVDMGVAGVDIGPFHEKREASSASKRISSEHSLYSTVVRREDLDRS
ncbi:zinc ribbon domain-containing protein [Azotobacter beijerinckii]|uniref:hypothetical protein n=1 Tax=Azotobacter beijerinckii TaxID=170623 RepID=UPI002953541E|nr:hypothetical protein [Azotobacter beijerinckii]